MQRTKIVTGLVVFSCLLACGKPPAKYTPPPPAPPSPKAEACTTKNDKSLDPARVVQRKTIDLQRQRQRTIRRKCDKVVISDQMESIKTPQQQIVIAPTSTKESELSGTAYNRTTCSGTGAGVLRAVTIMILPWEAIMDLGKSQIKFTVDTSPTFDNMHVRKSQDNFIDYEFTKCVQKGADKSSCTKSETVERGTMVLTVNYSELPDIETPREIDDCRKDVKPKN